MTRNPWGRRTGAARGHLLRFGVRPNGSVVPRLGRCALLAETIQTRVVVKIVVTTLTMAPTKSSG